MWLLTYIVNHNAYTGPRDPINAPINNMSKTELLHLKHNVHDICGTNVERIHADVNRKIYDYLFMHVIAYKHGSRQAIINFFLQRLYEECIEQGIEPVWDEENDEKVLAILNRLNFTPIPEPKVDKRKKKS